MKELIIVFFFGIVISASGIVPKKVYKHIDNILLILLMVLLFGMGINIGGNQEIITNLGKIGIQAFLISLFSIIGSVLAVWFLSKSIFRRES